MEEEQTTMPAPPRFRYKLFKYATLTLLFLVVLFSAGFVGLETTSSSTFCASCHEMKPEYYTLKASAHSEVACESCHVAPGVNNLAKEKANGIVELIKKETNRYTAPIQMPKDIPNSACESCHNMRTRQVTPSGDIIIPHTKHLDKDIKCVECHSGVAHGKIAERNVTFKTDYSKWDETLGKSMMSDVKFTRPKMDTCIECHQARGVSTACTTCHTTGMKPASHLQPTFKNGQHGIVAEKDVKKCHSCHQYMTEQDIKGLEDTPASLQFLAGGKIQNHSLSAQEYAKENTFCQKCHMLRPPSHVKGFVGMHGAIAKKSTQKCLACHDYLNTGFNKTNNITCSSCHPAMHAGKDFRAMHPIPLPVGQKPIEMCYTCHNKPKCTSCHKE